MNNIIQPSVIQTDNFVHFCTMSLPIGEKIKAKIKEKGWSVAKFAKEGSMSYRNAMHLFKRSDLSVEHLRQISKVLEYDFVRDFCLDPPNDQPSEEITNLYKDYHLVPKDYTTMVISLTIAGDSSTFERFPELIKKVRKDAENLGFNIL